MNFSWNHCSLLAYSFKGRPADSVSEHVKRGPPRRPTRRLWPKPFVKSRQISSSPSDVPSAVQANITSSQLTRSLALASTHRPRGRLPSCSSAIHFLDSPFSPREYPHFLETFMNLSCVMFAYPVCFICFVPRREPRVRLFAERSLPISFSTLEAAGNTLRIH